MAVEKEIIKCESIFSDDSLHRYMLSKVWDKTLPQANVITIAPSQDYNISCDLTTNIIQNNIHLLGMGGFTLTNLISKIGADVKKLKNLNNLWDKKTDQYILSCAEKSDKIILAWGRFADTRKAYAQREMEVLHLLKGFKNKIYQITDGNDREFLHPLTPVIRQGFILKKFNYPQN